MLEGITRLLHRFRRDKRAVSNVLVVVLSLAILVVIVSRVVLWSYEMNRLDWETMQEQIEISNVTKATPEGWYNAEWNYRAPIVIDNTLNTNHLTDFQVLVEMDTASLIASGKMRENCEDIRFTDSDGVTLISYWIESGVNSSNTRIWVKVPSIPAKLRKTIYVYYGNPDAASESDMTEVLEEKYTKIDVRYKWTARVSTVDVANGDDRGSWQNIPFSFPFWREMKNRIYLCSNGFGLFDPTSPTNDYSNSLSELRNRWMIAPFWDDLRTDVAGGIVSKPGVYVDSYSDHFVVTWEVTRYGDWRDSIKFQAILYRNGDVRINIDGATNFNDFSPTLGISKGDNVNYWDITSERKTYKSWLFTLRKYTYPEPKVSIGEEEVLDAGVLFEFRNTGSLTLQIVSLWINNSTRHERYDVSLFINSGEKISYVRSDIDLPDKPYTVKVVTERGNIAVYSEN